jgi:hypothetical protein
MPQSGFLRDGPWGKTLDGDARSRSFRGFSARTLNIPAVLAASNHPKVYKEALRTKVCATSFADDRGATPAENLGFWPFGVALDRFEIAPGDR